MELAGGIGGFAVLLLAGVLILREHAWTFTAKDIAYWSIVAGMIAVRLAHGRGQPAEVTVRRYVAILVPAAGVGWLVAQSVRV